MSERIQKLMAQAGIGSRRHNEKLIKQGRVILNGRLAQLGDKADLEKDEIKVDGRIINDSGHTYIALNKPKGVISSLEDELDEDRTTVRDLIPLPGHIYPVGRLDKQSEGLMLMTNDGKLAHRLTHPRYGHEKEYEVTLEGALADEMIEQWRRGLRLDDKMTAPAGVTLIERTAEQTRLQLTMREGRKRQIRRIAAQFGHPVQQLVRRKIGPLTLGNLQPGQWRHLTPAEVSALQKTVKRDA
ncbi:MAG: pseudouridine synthase [Chloroflexota bacterium]